MPESRQHARTSYPCPPMIPLQAAFELLSAPENTVINLPGALHATATARFIHLTRMADGAPLRPVEAPHPQPLADAKTPLSFGDITLTLMPHAPGGICPDGKRTLTLTRELMQTAVLRRPKPGDIIQPFGTDGSKPLRRYLTDQKLDLPFRPYLPVIASGRHVLWAVGVGAAESTRETPAPSILFTLQGDLPWLNTKQ